MLEEYKLNYSRCYKKFSTKILDLKLLLKVLIHLVNQVSIVHPYDNLHASIAHKNAILLIINLISK